MVLLRLNCHVTNLSASLEIFLPYQAVYYYLLDNPVSRPSFVPTVIAALHPSNTSFMFHLFLLQNVLAITNGHLLLWWVLWYFKEFKNAKLDKWQKMLLSLRSNPQTMSPYIHKGDSLCTRTDLSQTSFNHISTNSSTILTVSTATESPWKDLSIGTSHVSRRSVTAEILGRSTGNHHGTVH